MPQAARVGEEWSGRFEVEATAVDSLS